MASEFKYFVLLANMRTGSNLFEQNIRLYPEFSCHGELFNPSFIGFPDVYDLYGVSMQERELKPQKLLNRFISNEKNTLPGFRLFADHDPRILNNVLADPECAKIVLTRNPLDSFVSQTIAETTNQWKLTDVSARKKALVDFDILAFRPYLKKIQSYLTEIKQGLQKSGQTAFQLSFEDLNNVEVFNGLATFLGGAEPRKELNPTLVRQNPESLREKVVNYDEMVDQVGKIDLLALEAVPILEPVRNPGSKNFFGGNTVPILCLPMHKSEQSALANWLKAHEKQASGQGKLSRNMNQKQLGQWLADRTARHTIAVVTHPVERAYEAFYRHIFCTGDDLFPWIRTTLQNHYNMFVPEKKLAVNPNRSVLENSGYTVRNHQEAFTTFLGFIKGNLQGLTKARVDQSWASQNSILQGYCRLVFPDVVARKETLAEVLQQTEEKLGLPAIPLEMAAETPKCFELDEIYSPEIEAMARAAYARDYQMFGFGDWR